MKDYFPNIEKNPIMNYFQSNAMSRLFAAYLESQFYPQRGGPSLRIHLESDYIDGLEAKGFVTVDHWKWHYQQAPELTLTASGVVLMKAQFIRVMNHSCLNVAELEPIHLALSCGLTMYSNKEQILTAKGQSFFIAG